MPIPVRGGGLSDEGLSVELKGLPVDEVYTVKVDGEPHCVDASIYYEAEIGDQICLEYS